MNPNFILQQMIKNNPAMQQNPIMQNAFQMAQNGDEQGLRQLVENVAKSKNVDLNQLTAQVKQRYKI